MLRTALPRARALVPATQVARRTIFGAGYGMAKKMMPAISPTEKAALEAGGVSFEGTIFAGGEANCVDALVEKYQPVLSAKEQSFMDNEVNELCAMVDDHQIVEDRDYPVEVWDALRRKGFFCLKISEEWGGKGFSGYAVSKILRKIQTASGNVGATVAVPNSLGPGELLMAYGTPEQQKNFLPRLSSGELIPCFALTAPHSGSDAASMREADGIVVKNKDGSLGIRASFKKRYITLAPIAGIVGLAFNLHDPDNLMGGVGTEGISIALLERNHEGLRIGDRHDPVGTAFMNGTVEGDDVYIPMDALLGGQKMAGQGWLFLMEQLSEGRGISLPAGATGGAAMAAVGVGAYARMRKQFKVPIAEMGGVQEHLAKIAGESLLCVAGSDLVAALVDNHESPSVISAVMKQHATEKGRRVCTDAMDVMAGAAISRGPNNIVANMYALIPVGITVEGANTLTRTLMIFGQGVTRSHPHLLDVIKSIEHGDDAKGFSDQVFKMVGHGVSNSFASITRAITRPRSTPVGMDAKMDHYEAQLLRLSANFAAVSDLALTLGGALKREEMISGRMADALSALYLGYATLWWCKRQGDVEDLDILMDYALQTQLYEGQQALVGVAENFPIKPAGFVMRLVNAKWAGEYELPDDALKAETANLITNDTAVWRMMQEDVYVPTDDSKSRLGLMVHTMGKAVEADALARVLKKSGREPTEAEAALLTEVEQARDAIVQVDSFAKLGYEKYDDTYVRPALRPWVESPAAPAAASATA